MLRLKKLFHKHEWEYVSDDESSWASSFGSFVCYSANYRCSKCDVKGKLDAGSRMMNWSHNIYEIKQ